MTKEQFIDSLFGKMTIVVDRNRYNYIYFKIEDKIYMRYDLKTDNLWCDYLTIWSVLSSKYGCNDLEIKQLIKGMVEQHFKIGVVTPWIKVGCFLTEVEQHFKIGVVTPINSEGIHPPFLMERIKA